MDARDSTSNRDVSSSAGGTAGGGGVGGEDDSPRTLGYTSTPRVASLDVFRVDRDCELLEQERIMDYSLLVGLHFREVSPNGDLITSGMRTPPGSYIYFKQAFEFSCF
uniref:PIPK domain-containing protein n=1 Tax=Salix viminalis TaxID=40686 RepID=A0A6N2M6M6_SALVM